MTWVSCCLLICLFVCLHIPWQRDEMMVWFVNVPPTPQRPAWVNVFAAAVLIFSPFSHISFLFLCLSHSLTFSFPLLRLMREVWEIKRGPGPLMQPCWGPKCVCGVTALEEEAEEAERKARWPFGWTGSRPCCKRFPGSCICNLGRRASVSSALATPNIAMLSPVWAEALLRP